jgi:hypothetical protein
MGRLVGLRHFLSEDALAEEKADASKIRRAKGGDAEDGPLEDDSPISYQIVVAQRMQRQFEGRVIRRTIDSVDWKKEPLISLPPYKEVMIIVTPTPREMEIIEELADRVKER